MDTATLIHTLITRGDYQELRGAHQTLRDAVIYATTYRDESDNDRELVRCILDYGQRYGKYPTYEELDAYLEGRHLDGRLPADLMGKRLLEIQADAPLHKGSMAQLLDEYTHLGRTGYVVSGLRHAMAIATMGVDGDPARRELDMKGPDDAMRYLKDHAAKDFSLPPTSPQGAWRQNADVSADALIAGLKSQEKERCTTGLRHVDAKVSIGPQKEVRYVGILGSSHHGKSLLMRQIAYNMAANGKNVLYVPLEESPLTCWTRFSFLHAYHRRDLDIPAIATWEHAKTRIRAEHEDNLRLLTEDLKFGKSVPGDIVVMTLRRWVDIAQEVNAGHNGKPYDSLFVDYVAHLQTGVSGFKHRDEMLKIFRDAQELSQTYKGGNGLVIVTGVQANKESVAKADEEEGEYWGTYPAMGAFDQYTDAQRDMDAIITVWQKGLLRTHNMMKIASIKNRGGEMFVPHFVGIDRRTSSIYDLQGTPKSDLALISTYRAVEEEIERAGDVAAF